MAARIELGIARNDDGVNHLIGKAVGDSEQECLDLAELVMKAFSENRETFMRVKPEAETWTDFDTKEVHHRAYVRFSFIDRPGPVHEPEYNVNIPFGLT